jgi:hypothetical protein
VSETMPLQAKAEPQSPATTEPCLHGRETSETHPSCRSLREWRRSPRIHGRCGRRRGHRLTHHYLLRHDVQDLPRHVDHLLDVLALRELLHAVLGEGQLLRGVLGRVRS